MAVLANTIHGEEHGTFFMVERKTEEPNGRSENFR
jgi:hypothetical protein